ncbi:hypothetical protein M0812_29585 [Anaeramoeba flamelloides]|uniref:Uncharacterized protein n=1 Tax=Anaeramoeba flamelloides TaxID=1746091 RepID=A0AAV7Y8V5_9EUKA|nr:hypothetical protein M0812_29585 [Anaeramoeba flamelloides]
MSTHPEIELDFKETQVTGYSTSLYILLGAFVVIFIINSIKHRRCRQYTSPRDARKEQELSTPLYFKIITLLLAVINVLLIASVFYLFIVTIQKVGLYSNAIWTGVFLLFPGYNLIACGLLSKNILLINSLVNCGFCAWLINLFSQLGSGECPIIDEKNEGRAGKWEVICDLKVNLNDYDPDAALRSIYLVVFFYLITTAGLELRRLLALNFLEGATDLDHSDDSDKGKQLDTLDSDILF